MVDGERSRVKIQRGTSPEHVGAPDRDSELVGVYRHVSCAALSNAKWSQGHSPNPHAGGVDTQNNGHT